MQSLPITGKGVYIWTPERIGTPSEVADALEASHTAHVAIKIHDAGTVWNVEPYVLAIRQRGIKVGAWGYVYLKWNALAEAKGAIEAIRRYNPDYYLIDAEGEAQGQFMPAALFAKTLRKGAPGTPMGLNSYWKPSYHPNLPWKALRAICDFDAPQIYWRGATPTVKYQLSKKEYAAMKPRLPFALPAGDMFIERGVKPTPQQLSDWMVTCHGDPEAQGFLLWSMDQKNKVPELWDTYSRYNWSTGSYTLPPPVPEPEQPCYTAVTIGRLNVRRGAGTNFAVVETLPKGGRVDVYGINSGWAWITPDKTHWVSVSNLKKV